MTRYQGIEANMEINKIYLGDCYQLIKQVPDKSVDLIVTDTPYDMEGGGAGKTELAVRFHNRYQELRENKLHIGLDMGFLQELEKKCKHIYIYMVQ